jgi:glycerol-3-phosphate acyltransferase PlsY
MSLISIAMAFLAFFCGSLPFSVWLGKGVLGLDVRRIGDGNPGALNAFKTGNKWVGLLTLLLDISKAAAPVGFAYFNLNIRGFPMFLIAIAPVLGHAFSPFLGFRGGKAIATTLGVWIGLTLWIASIPGVVLVTVGIALFTPPGWSVMLGLAGILVALLIWLPDPLLLGVWCANFVILVWKHRTDLRQGLHLRPWLARIFPKTRT